MGKKYRVGCKGLDEYGKGKIVFNNKPFSVPYMLPGEKGRKASRMTEMPEVPPKSREWGNMNKRVLTA